VRFDRANAGEFRARCAERPTAHRVGSGAFAASVRT
jgi:hypothetical protein